MKIISAALLLFTLIPFATTAAPKYGANDAEFMNFVGSIEAPQGFSDVFNGVPFLPDSLVETKTIEEILTYQRSLRAYGTESTAIGRYQFIYKTLLYVVDVLNVDKNRIFDSEMQTFLARYLMEQCGFYDTSIPTTALGNCLAGQWASLPLLSGVNKGKSAYADVGSNKALTSTVQYREILENRFSW
jgi:hypothetical protein